MAVVVVATDRIAVVRGARRTTRREYPRRPLPCVPAARFARRQVGTPGGHAARRQYPRRLPDDLDVSV
jgi:hypothetical protein